MKFLKIFSLSILFFSTTLSFAEDVVDEGYIEALRRKHGIESHPADTANRAPEKYIDKLKEKHEIKAQEEKPSYTETVKAKEGDSSLVQGSQPYLDKVLDKNGGADGKREGQPHIEAVKSGKELEPKYDKKSTQSAGITVAANGNLEIEPKQGRANSFESVYNTKKKYNPTIDLHYEYHFLKHRLFGDLGPMGKIGFIYTKGYGRFTTRNAESDVRFSFIAIPVSTGVSYRASQLRIVVPYVQAAVVSIPMLESRNDGKPSKRGLGFCYSYTLGVGLNLDWIGGRDAWARYDEYGILHTSLVLQFQELKALGGKVSLNSSTTMVGLNFDF